MGDENGGQTSFLVKIQKKAEDRLAGFPVQVAGRLVGQKDGRVVDQGPGDGHPLHLAAGKLGRAAPGLARQPHLSQPRPLMSIGRATFSAAVNSGRR